MTNLSLIGERLSITHIGDSYLAFRGFKIPHAYSHIVLKDILLVPSIIKILLNVSKLTGDNNISIKFFGSFCVVKDLLKG